MKGRRREKGKLKRCLAKTLCNDMFVFSLSGPLFLNRAISKKNDSCCQSQIVGTNGGGGVVSS